MSSLTFHTVQSIVTSAALYPVMGENVIPFGLAVVLIDLDHAVEYVRDTKSFDLRGLFAFSKLIEINLNKKYLVLSALHTVEFFGLVFMLSLFFPVLKYVLAGLLYHMAADILHLIKLRQLFARAYSLVEYVYRSSNPRNLTSIHQLLIRKDLATEGVRDFEFWKRHWEAVRSRLLDDYAN